MVETNLFVMFKVKKGQKLVTNWCLPKEQFRSFRGKQITLRFDPPENKINEQQFETCNSDCVNFEVFIDLDNAAALTLNNNNNNLTNNVVDWYIGKHFVTGFKNYKYNGIPISDTWLNPNIFNSMNLQ